MFLKTMKDLTYNEDFGFCYSTDSFPNNSRQKPLRYHLWFPSDKILMRMMLFDWNWLLQSALLVRSAPLAVLKLAQSNHMVLVPPSTRKNPNWLVFSWRFSLLALVMVLKVNRVMRHHQNFADHGSSEFVFNDFCVISP